MRRLAWGAIVALVLVLAGCGGTASKAAAERSPCGGRPSAGGALLAPTRPFSAPIPANARPDRRSPTMVRSLLAAVQGRHFVLTVRNYTTPIYYALPTSPHYDVRLTAEWSHGTVLRGVPIPPSAQPDPSEDA